MPTYKEWIEGQEPKSVDAVYDWVQVKLGDISSPGDINEALENAHKRADIWQDAARRMAFIAGRWEKEARSRVLDK